MPTRLPPRSRHTPGRQGQLWALQGAGGATGSRLGRSPGARGLRTHLGLISRQLGDHPSSAHSDGGHTAWGGGERRCPARQTGRRTPCRKQAGRAHTPGRPSQAGHPASVPFNPPNTLKVGTTSTRPVSRMRKLRPKERSHSPTTAQLGPEHIRAHVLVAFQARPDPCARSRSRGLGGNGTPASSQTPLLGPCWPEAPPGAPAAPDPEDACAPSHGVTVRFNQQRPERIRQRAAHGKGHCRQLLLPRRQASLSPERDRAAWGPRRGAWGAAKGTRSPA